MTAQGLADQRRQAEREYVNLVQQNEELSKRDPKALRRKVVLLAIFGYAYIIGTIVASIALFVLCILFVHVGYLIVALALFILSAIGSLWVRSSKPTGLELTRADAPVLWEEIDRISAEVHSIKINQILVDRSMNAAACQVPMLGIFGVYRNYMLIGLPLMMCLTPEQYRSVIAHEMGHFGGKHGKFSSWAYRVNQTWSNLSEAMPKRRFGTLVYMGFFNWYQPRFSAATFVLYRDHEYEADSVAARIAGVEAAGEALLRMECVAPRSYKEFWHTLDDRAGNEPEPPAHLFDEFETFSREPMEVGYVATQIAKGMAEVEAYEDTHPSLQKRLSSMGFPFDTGITERVQSIADPLDKTAAEYYLGGSYAKVKAEWNRRFFEDSRAVWVEEFQEKAANRSELESLEQRASQMPLTPDERYQRAELVASVRSDEEAVPLLESLLKDNPNHVYGHMLLGALLLRGEDEQGVTHVRSAMSLDPQIAVHGLELIRSFEARRGNADASVALREEMHDIRAASDLAQFESLHFSLTDSYISHQVAAKDVEILVEMLRKEKNVKRAYLVLKQLPSMPEKPSLTIIIIRKSLRAQTDATNSAYAHELAAKLRWPLQFTLYCPVDVRKWTKRMDAVPGGLIYDSKAKS